MKSFAALFLLSFALTTCSNDREPHVELKTQKLVYDFAANTSPHELNDAEEAGLNALSAQVPPKALKMVVIETAFGMDNDIPKIEDIRQLLVRSGFEYDNIETIVSPKPMVPLRVNLLYKQFPDPETCTHWRDPGPFNVHDNTGSRLGCANAVNLMAMATDTKDLLRKRGTSDIVPETSFRAIDAYKNGDIRPIQTTSENETTSSQ